MADINQTATVITRINDQNVATTLEGLSKRAATLRVEIVKALAAGDTKTAKNLQKQFDSVNKEMRRIQSAAVDVQKVMNNLSGVSLQDLTRTLNKLQREFGQTEQSSPRFNELSEAIVRVKTQIRQVREEIKIAGETLSVPPVPPFFDRIKNGFAGIRAAIQPLVNAYRSLIASIQPYADMEEQMAETRKFTGLKAEEVEELNEAFKRMDTRSSREQLNQLAQEAGRLGKDTVEEVKQYVEAADIIHVALNDLGEDATETVYKIASIFHVDQDLGTRDAMLAVGSAVNTLSQNSVVSSNFLVEFSQRMAGVGATAKLSVPDILAYASTLSASGMQVEQSSSALGRLTMKLFQEPAKMAKEAGLDVKQFTDTLKRDTNEALLMFLERIHELGQNGGVAVLAPMFKDMGANGVGLTNVLTSLADNIDMVRQQQQIATDAFREGNSVLEEAAIGNQTVQARLDKHKKDLREIAVALGEKLMPVMDAVIVGTSGFLKVFTATGKFLKDYGGYLIAAAAGVAAYTIAVKASAIADAVHTAAIRLKERVLIAATKAQLAFNTAAKANPWAFVAAAITAAAVAVGVFIKKQREVTAEQKLHTDVQKQVAKQYGEEKGKIDLLADAVRDETRSLKDRQKALNELRTIVPEYHGELTAEGKLINDNKDAIDRYCEALNRQMMLQAYQERLQEQYNRRAELEMQKDELTAQEKQAQSNLQNVSYTNRAAVAGSVAVTDATVWQDQLKHTQRELEKTEKEAAEVDALIKSINTKINGLKPADAVAPAKPGQSAAPAKPEKPEKPAATTAAPKDDPIAEWRTRQLTLNDIYYQQGVLQHEEYQRRKLEIERDYQKQRMDAAEQGSAEYLQAEAAYLKAESDLTRQSLQLTVSEENEAYQATQQTLRQKYMDGLMTAETYHRAMEEAELQHLYNLTQIYDEGSTERLRAQDQYQQAAIAAQERHAREAEQQADQAVRTIVDDINAFLESDGTKAFAKTMQQAVGAMSNIFSSLTSVVDAETQIQTAAIENRYKKEVERAGENTELVASLEKQKEAEIAKVKAEASEKKFKMDVFSTIAQGAMSAVSAWNAGWQAGFPAGPILAPLFMALSLATTGVQIAALKKQQQAAAATGYAEGGYTRKGRKYEPAGIVHAGEWVASQELLQNPATAAVIAALDHAQRTNTIGSLGTAVVQRSSPASIGTPALTDPSLARALHILTRRLNEPFITVNTVEGNRGIKRAQDRYNRLTKNR